MELKNTFFLNILLNVVGLVLNENSDTLNCTVLRDSFADASSEFIRCSIEYSRPITFCEECVKQYLSLVDSYNNMSKVAINGTPCINNFINLDRLQIVQTLYQNSINLWNRAKCYECFTTENGSQTNKRSNETQLFITNYEDFVHCINRTNSKDLCANCMENYLILQDYYFSISNENEKIGMCVDVVDLMNNTWLYWGDKCCKFRKHNEYVYLCSTLVVLLATILFYLFSKFWSKKKSPTIIQQSRFSEAFNNLST